MGQEESAEEQTFYTFKCFESTNNHIAVELFIKSTGQRSQTQRFISCDLVMLIKRLDLLSLAARSK